MLQRKDGSALGVIGNSPSLRRILKEVEIRREDTIPALTGGPPRRTHV